MTLPPVAARKPQSWSTPPVVMLCVNGWPDGCAGAVPVPVQLLTSTSLAPIRITGEPRSLKSAIKLAFVLVSEPLVMWVFSKLNPAKPGPIVPTVLLGFTVTVAVTPAPVGPPATGVPHPGVVLVAPAAPPVPVVVWPPAPVVVWPPAPVVVWPPAPVVVWPPAPVVVWPPAPVVVWPPAPVVVWPPAPVVVWPPAPVVVWPPAPVVVWPPAPVVVWPPAPVLTMTLAPVP